MHSPAVEIDVEAFRRNGWVAICPFDDGTVNTIQRYVAEVTEWPDADAKWLHYRELTDFGPRLCRTENFVPFHAGLRDLLTSGPLLHIASSLLEEPAVLYKEKINYKLAGGAGYAPHQDAPAYRFVENHISCMIAIDDADDTNGCLQVVSGEHHQIHPVNDDGCIREDVVERFTWESLPVSAGTTLWFHSRTPHRSGPNLSDRDRRAIYPTYNALREGDLRSRYYEQKLREFAQRSVDGKVQVSLINDFQGRPVTT